MKKIININLSGRVIPIEDSAYESLQRYIESLRRYFINEEGRDEIINDIESRMAELMNDKVRKGSTAITDADVDEIIASMGRVEDFAETEPDTESATGTSANVGTFGSAAFKQPRGRLYRDPNDKILGGVCSGLANYFNVDPSIVRLLFALLVFGAGTGILAYIVLWIILPTRPLGLTPAPQVKGKRLFRNPDDRMLGGVCGGLAAYFNKDSWLFRLVFAAPLVLNILFGTLNGMFFMFHREIFPHFVFGSFTGTFVITYIILWIILPEARTPYDKMEMRGEKVDVNTIKQNVQEGMSDFKNRMQAWGEEVKTSAQEFGQKASAFANTQGKQFASEVHQTTRPVGSSFGRVIGTIFKAFFIFIAASIAFGLFVILMTFLFSGGIAIGSTQDHLSSFFFDGFWQYFFFWGTLILFFAVPVIAFFTWLVRRIMKIRTRRHSLGWVFASLWFLGVIFLISLVSSVGRDFFRGDKLDQVIPIAQPANGKLIVRVDEPVIKYSGDLWFIDAENGWDFTADSMMLSDIKVRVAKSEDTSYNVTVQRYSRGASRTVALERAGRIRYNVMDRDSILDLGSGFAIDRRSKYRGQRLIVEIAVPAGKRIYFDQSVVDKLNEDGIRLKNRTWPNRYRRDWDYDWNYDDYFAWQPGTEYVMTAEGKLEPANLVKQDIATPNTTIKADSLQKIIEERERQNELDKERLQRMKDSNRNVPGVRESTTYHRSQKGAISMAIPFIPMII
jgi:phage shock protein PspC (stress-responsive transcriptional regulator)